MCRPRAAVHRKRPPSTPQGHEMATKTAKHTPATKPVSWRVCVFTFWHPFGRQADPKGAETTPQAPHKDTKWSPKRHNTHPPRNQFRGGCALTNFGTHLDAKRSPKGQKPPPKHPTRRQNGHQNGTIHTHLKTNFVMGVRFPVLAPIWTPSGAQREQKRPPRHPQGAKMSTKTA